MGLPDILQNVRRRPSMYLRETTFNAAVAFVDGYNCAQGGGLLVGFREWLIVRSDGGSSLAWSQLVHGILEGLATTDEAARVEGLFSLLDEFLEGRGKHDGLRRIYHAYEGWLAHQSWYSPESPSWLSPVVGKRHQPAQRSRRGRTPRGER